jgi:hypothetical protein
MTPTKFPEVVGQLSSGKASAREKFYAMAEEVGPPPDSMFAVDPNGPYAKKKKSAKKARVVGVVKTTG